MFLALMGFSRLSKAHVRTHTQLSPATSHRAQLHFSKFPQPCLVSTMAPATHPLAMSELRGLGPAMATWFPSPAPASQLAPGSRVMVTGSPRAPST